MNYRHLYHAGNFADVFKHSILISLLSALSKKENPWCYLETHAGSGSYDLNSKEAKKTNEFKDGIEKIFKEASELKPKTIQKYLAIVQKNGYPNFYPGSPLIASHCLRESDRMVLTELHSVEAEHLKHLFYHSSNVAVHLMDGYQSVKAFMPPKERRGLVLIDPPFEKEGEWKQILSTMEMGLKQFPSGVYAIWYPIKEHNKVALLHRGLKELNCKEVLIAELCIYPDDIPQGLPGCGLAIVNPPWKIAETLSPLVKWIWQRLSINNGGYSKVAWLKREVA